MKSASRGFSITFAVACLPLAAGCDGGSSPIEGTMDPEVFVSVMAQLSQVYQFPPAGTLADDRHARADSLRSQILREHGVTAEQLIEFAERAGRDPTRMEELAERIAALNDSLTAARDPAEATTPEAMTPRVAAPRTREAQPPDEEEQSMRSRLDSLRLEFRRSQP